MRYIFEKVDDLLNATVIFGYDKIGYWARRPLWDAAETNVSLKGKVCIVTGANAGLGKATCLRLAELGATIYMLCRNQQRGAGSHRLKSSIKRAMKLYFWKLWI